MLINKDKESDRGSMMMEYVVLNFLFVVAVAIAGYFFVSPDGGTPGQATYRIDPDTGAVVTVTETTRRYGILGDAFLRRYDLMVKIVSMPYP